MGRGGKYGHPKVRDVKRSNEYGGRHRSTGGYKMPEEHKPGWLEQLKEDLEGMKKKINKLKKFVDEYEKVQKLKASGDRGLTAEEAKDILNWMFEKIENALELIHKIKLPSFDVRNVPWLNNGIDNTEKIKNRSAREIEQMEKEGNF